MPEARPEAEEREDRAWVIVKLPAARPDLRPESVLDAVSALISAVNGIEQQFQSVFACVAHKFTARASFMFIGCCCWQSLVVDGGPGTSRARVPVVRRPGSQRYGAVERSPVFRPGVSQRIALQNLLEVPGRTTSSKCSVILGSSGCASEPGSVTGIRTELRHSGASLMA